MRRRSSDRTARPVAVALVCGTLVLAAGPRPGAQDRSQAEAVAAARAQLPVLDESIRPKYRLAAGDIIELKFPYNIELNETVTIRPDGFVSLQLVGDVDAENVTPPELAARLTDMYSAFLPHPQVAVIVREFAGQRAYVGGEVVAPGPLTLRGRITALQAIVQVGGVKVSGKRDSVMLIRYLGAERAEARRLHLDRIIGGRDEDVLLRPYDVIFVPKTRIARMGQAVEQYVNSLIPRALMFPYNLNTAVTIREER